MLDRHITKEGTLIYENGRIYVDDWDVNGAVMCREMAILACLYVARKLIEEASHDIREAGGSGMVGMGLPDYHPGSPVNGGTDRG